MALDLDMVLDAGWILIWLWILIGRDGLRTGLDGSVTLAMPSWMILS